jgi:hypothetical protein
MLANRVPFSQKARPYKSLYTLSVIGHDAPKTDTRRLLYRSITMSKLPVININRMHPSGAAIAHL